MRLSKERNKIVLTIDIGNTNAGFAVFNKGRLLTNFKLSTKLVILSRDNLSGLKRILMRKLPVDLIKIIVICSVVPKATLILEKLFKVFSNGKVLILGKNINVDIKNLYKNPKQVGQDRLVAAYAAYKIYGAPIIVVDFGTATTFDVVSKRGQYLGGVIAPGLEISLKALHENTALLPKVSLKKPKGILGRDTKSSILSGIFFGFGLLCDGIINELKKYLGYKRIKVIATGGNAALMKMYCHKIDVIDEILIFKGLEIISRQFKYN